MSKLMEEAFLEYFMQRSNRLQAHLQNILYSNGKNFDLSTLDINKMEEGRNSLLEQEIEIIQEMHAHKFPHIEIWKVKLRGDIVGQFEIDIYGVITDI